MPELPEVECVRRSLERLAVGALVLGVDVRRSDIIARASAQPTAGRARTRRRATDKNIRVPHAELLVGSVVTRILRHGKQLALVASSDDDGVRGEHVLMAHLGMTGHFIHAPRAKQLSETDHVHVVWRLAVPAKASEVGGWTHRLAFRDPRRFGGLTTFPSVTALEDHWSHIGPDALAITPDALAAATRDSARPIKALLLDQQLIAGVGNIYADEALFDSRIHPTTPAGALASPALSHLAASIRDVLTRAVAAGGSTVRSYSDADGTPGAAQDAHRVYGRSGEPCVRCGTSLSTAQVAQRTTVWCPVCQPSPTTRRKARKGRLST